MDQDMPRRSRRRRMTAEERKEAMARRDEAVALRMATFRQFREAIVLISGLPRATDMAQLVRTFDRNSFVKRRIPGIAQWMRDFENAWNASEDKGSS